MIRGLRLIPSEHRVERDGVSAILVSTHFRALELMVEAHPAPVHRDDILDRVAGKSRARLFSDERYTSRLISGARQAMRLLGCDVVLSGRSAWRVVDLSEEDPNGASLRADEGPATGRQAHLRGHRLPVRAGAWAGRGREAQAPASVMGLGRAASVHRPPLHAQEHGRRDHAGASAHP
jgi:hypothetical protein